MGGREGLERGVQTGVSGLRARVQCLTQNEEVISSTWALMTSVI